MSAAHFKLISRTFIFFALLASLLGSAVFVTPAYAAGLTVNSNADTTADDGACTLREAIDNANSDSQLYATSGECAVGSGSDTINFDASLSGQTIFLASTLNLLEDLTIDGSSLASKITMSGGGSVRVFYVGSRVTAMLDSLIVTQGRVTGNGGGLFNDGTLTITNILFSANTIDNAIGGAILNNQNSILTIADSTFSGNSAYNGGAITNLNQLTITNSTFLNNTSADVGGAIYNNNEIVEGHSHNMLTVTNTPSQATPLPSAVASGASNR